MWGALVKLVVGIFSALFKTSMEHPIEKTEEVKDVGRKQPENPDDAFSPDDF